MIKLAVLISGGGSNLEAILEAVANKQIPEAEVRIVISSRADAYGLERARQRKVEALVIDMRQYHDIEAFDEALLTALQDRRIDVVCLAGYLKKLGPRTVKAYPGRILNIHPALLPKYGGAGMYGHRVHEAVLSSGDKESGCSVHLVDEEFDRGPILAQARVPVLPGDTPDSLARRVLEQEHILYPQVIRHFCEQLRSQRTSRSSL